MKLPAKPMTTARPRGSSTATQEIPTVISLSPPPVKQVRLARPPKEVRVVDLSQKENEVPQKENIDDNAKDKVQEEQDSHAGAAPLGKLASKMKLMLRRKNTNDKKKPKKKEDYWAVDRMDDVHWTEM